MCVSLQGMFWVPASQVLGRAAGLRLLPLERGSDHSGRAGLPGWYGDTVMLVHDGWSSAHIPHNMVARDTSKISTY